MCTYILHFEKSNEFILSLKLSWLPAMSEDTFHT